MKYLDYKAHLQSQGWVVAARYVGTGEESMCDMTHPDCKYWITVSVKGGEVVASASITLRGFINIISTGDFGSPWNNKAFFTQVQRLEKIKLVMGDSLIL
jgi:hypothetical protein